MFNISNKTDTKKISLVIIYIKPAWNMDNKLNILVVEDEIKVVEAVKAYLEKDGYKVSFALLGSAALNIVKEKKIHLIILDLMLPDMKGEDVCAAVRKTSDVPIIMLTAKSSEESRVNGLNIGADDYLVKPFSPRELAARVKAVIRRAIPEGVVENKIISFHGGLQIDYETPKTIKNGAEIPLTPNEFKLLSFLSQNPDRFYSREQLIEFAFGAKWDGYDRAVDSHIKNLRQKIEDNPKTPKYIITQYGFGYKFAGVKK